MGLDINTKKLKKNAFRVSKVRGIGASRIRVPGGYLDARVLSMVQEIAEEYGNGYVHLTTRQGFEIEGIRLEDMEEINKKLQPIIELLGINQEEAGKGYPASGTTYAPLPTTTRRRWLSGSKRKCSPMTCILRSPAPAAPMTVPRPGCMTSGSSA